MVMILPKRSTHIRIKFVRRPKIIDLESFLQYLLNTDQQIEQAIKIIQILKKEQYVPVANWRKFVIHSVGLYTDTMFKLKQAGLVEKKGGFFSLSREFIYGLRKLLDFWDDYTS